jgi:hypothetical protein
MQQPFFKDISKFNKVSDYLPIVAAVLCVETFTIFYAFVVNKKYRSSVLESWYKTYRLAAVLADVTIVIIGIIITRFLYPYIFPTSGFSIIKFVGLAVCVQIVHDILFYLFFSAVPVGMNRMLDTFKIYSKEVGLYAVLGDSIIMISSCLIASNLANYNTNLNIISLIVSLYFIPYVIYHK